MLRLLTLLFFCALAFGQSVSSEVFGDVLDVSGAVIPHVPVTITETATGGKRTVTTDDRGRYRFAGLAPGKHELTAEREGLKAAHVIVDLLVNQQASVDLTLQLLDVRETVPVTDEAPLLQYTSPAMSGVVTGQELRGLPLNGRDLSQLMLLQTGVVATTTAGPSPWSDGLITKAAVQGSRPTMNNLTLDGADINDPGYGVQGGGPSGAQLGVEAVREYRVLLNNYSAEYGRNAGANVQYITKSGTNDLHGSLYEFNRNAALDARNFFDRGDTPSFTRNQFGFSLGGPIQKNRTFLFGNFEGLREDRSITSSISVPDANARLGLLPAANNPAALVNIGVSPAVKPILNLYPAPNGAELGGGLAQFDTSRVQPTGEEYYMARLDHHLSDKSLVVARYVQDRGRATVPFLSTLVPGFEGRREIGTQYAQLGLHTLFSPAIFNEAQVHFNRTSLMVDSANQQPLSISLSPGRAMGTISITGVPVVGNGFIYPLTSKSNTFEFVDNTTLYRGRHTLKFGIDMKRIQSNGKFDFFTNGYYAFSDLSPFGIPAASNNGPLEFFLRAFPFLYFGVDPKLADSTRGYRQNYAGLYVQDDWQITSRLTLNLGIRWEYHSVPSEANGRTANVRNILTDKTATVGSIWKSAPLDLWSPRLGLAWASPRKTTVVRAGVGLFRDQFWANLYGNTRFYEPFFRPVVAVLPRFLTPPTSLTELGGQQSVVGSFGMAWDPQWPYYVKYNVSVEHQLTKDVMAEAAYVGSRGRHLLRTGEANLTPAGPRNPAFGSDPLIVTDANSSYHSAQFSVWKRSARGLTLRGSYTFSKSLDDGSGAFPSDWVSESGVSQNFFNRRGDRARSTFDRQHVFTGSFLYDLPFRYLKNWRAGGIVSLMSGPPFTANLGTFNNSGTSSAIPADRPDLKAGANGCASTLGSADRWFDPSIFRLPAPGQYGNAGRNIMCGPSLKNVDLVISRSFRLAKETNLEFRAEMFNAFNHTNLSVPVNTQGPTGNGGNGDAVFFGRNFNCNPAQDGLGCGIPAPNAGRIFSTVTSSRQIQLAVRLVF